jgi:HEAT repeat protein
MSCRNLLVAVLLLSLAGPASAGLIFGKRKPKPSPAERVPELINIVKSDGDENKRQNAVEELRQYDPSAFAAIVPALIEALLTDKKPAVRAEAAQSLGKLRPISQEAGQALEEALHGDSSMRVRLQARSALLQYHWAGYHGGKDVPPVEPALKDPPSTPPAVSTSARPPTRIMPQAVPVPLPQQPTTREPPLAAPLSPATPAKLPPGPPSPPQGGPDLGPPF